VATAGVTREELEQWIEICDEWITTQQYENPYAPFPKPISPYVLSEPSDVEGNKYAQ
jgi:hypothetical protein